MPVSFPSSSTYLPYLGSPVAGERPESKSNARALRLTSCLVLQLSIPQIDLLLGAVFTPPLRSDADFLYG